MSKNILIYRILCICKSAIILFLQSRKSIRSHVIGMYMDSHLIFLGME